MDPEASKSNAKRKAIKRWEKSHSQLDSLRQQGRAGFPSTIGFVCTRSGSVRDPGAEDSVCVLFFRLLDSITALGRIWSQPRKTTFPKDSKIERQLKLWMQEERRHRAKIWIVFIIFNLHIQFYIWFIKAIEKGLVPKCCQVFQTSLPFMFNIIISF